MALWAIVPVKPLRRGKSRLAEVLNPDERTALNRRLLAHTIDTLSKISEIEQVLVISRDQAALSMAHDHGARTVQENGAPKLNTALTRATVVAKNYATRGVLIIPADLPLLNSRRYLHYDRQRKLSTSCGCSPRPSKRRNQCAPDFTCRIDRIRIWSRVF